MPELLLCISLFVKLISNRKIVFPLNETRCWLQNCNYFTSVRTARLVLLNFNKTKLNGCDRVFTVLYYILGYKTYLKLCPLSNIYEYSSSSMKTSEYEVVDASTIILNNYIYLFVDNSSFIFC